MMRVTRLTAVKNAARLGDDRHREGAARRAAASSSAATPPATSPSVRTASSTPPPARARASTPWTTASTSTRARTPADEGGSLRSQDYRSASDALGVDGTIVKMDPVTGFTPVPGHRRQLARRLRPAQPVAAHLPAGHQRALVRRRRRQRVGGGQPDPRRHPGDLARSTAAGPATRAASPAQLVQPGWDALDKPLCESLYAAGAVGGQRAVLQLPDPGSAADARRGLPQRHVVGLRHRVRLGEQQLPRGSTRVRCSSPTTPAPACGCWGRSRTATPTRPSSSRSCRTPRRRWTWCPVLAATSTTSTTASTTRACRRRTPPACTASSTRAATRRRRRASSPPRPPVRRR